MSELPKGWARVPLREVAEVRLGRQRSPDRATGANMRPYLRAANVTWGGLDLSDVKEMDFTPREFETYELREGDILLSEASGSASEVGKPAMFRGAPPGSCFQNTLIRVRSRGPLPEYLHLHFLADARLGRFAAVGKGSGINHLGADRMSTWPTAIPPLNEQRRIVAKLEALQDRSRRAREALDAVPPLLEKLRQSILAAAFRGDLTKDWRAKNPDVEPADKLLARIRTERRKKWEEAELAKLKAKGKPPTDDRWKSKYREPEPVDTAGLPSLPMGWAWTSLDEVSTRVTDGTHQSPEFMAEGVPFLVIANVITGRIDWNGVGKWVSRETFEEATARCRPGRGDVLYTAVGSYGVAIPVETEDDFMFQRHIAHIRPLGSVVASRFLGAALNAPQTRARADAVARGVAQKTVTLGELAKFPIPVPPLSEQHQVVAALDGLTAAVESTVTRMHDTSERLAAFDRSTLAKAFRGELVPQDPADEPADLMLARLRSDEASPGAESPAASTKRVRSGKRKAS